MVVSRISDSSDSSINLSLRVQAKSKLNLVLGSLWSLTAVLMVQSE